MITSERMAAVDANAAALGVPQSKLMESSGNAVARVVRDVADDGRVCLVAGRGNNGGDALAAARFLDADRTTVLLLERPSAIRTEIAWENYEALVAAEYDVQVVTDSTEFALPECDVVVDALLGTGVTGAAREPEATAIEAMNESSATVVSVDVPSGMDADSGDAAGAVVGADAVVTFHDVKPGLAEYDGEVVVADIGVPDAAETFVGPGDLHGLHRDPSSHKGDHGEVLVVGGGPYAGAPALAAQAAYRAGADLVRVACPSSVASEIQGFGESLILRPFDGDRFTPAAVDGVAALAAEHDVTVLGPGLGSDPSTLDAVREFLSVTTGTVVVDADALQVVPDVETDATLICTPHRGEFVEMGGTDVEDWRDRVDHVATLASDLGATVLVKGRYDVISDGTGTRVNRTGNPGMTVGGTGDVLAGATSALACVLDPLDAAAVAAYATGAAGEVVYDRQGYGMLPTDVLAELPAALWGDR